MIPRISHISWRFTILLLGEIGRQLVKAPLASAIRFELSIVLWGMDWC